MLGKLDNSGVDASGIGLYCDNVFLKGSLTAYGPVKGAGENNYYSGIHTSQNFEMPLEDNKSKEIYFPSSYVEEINENGEKIKKYITGDILLWAGATGDTKEEVQAAPFRVDSLGNFYAGSGYFKGSIISEATITAAVMEAVVMRTAILEGWNKKDH